MINYFKFSVTFGLALFLMALQTVSAAIVINEIHYRPSSLNEDEEFIELFNSGTTSIDLSAWHFDDGIDFTFPDNTILEAGGYLIVTPSPEHYSNQNPDILVYGPYQGQLSNDGEAVRLVNQNGIPVESLSYQDELGWPENADGLGPSIERIHPEMNPSHPASWKTGPNLGTPGSENSSTIDQPLPIVDKIIQNPASPNSDQEVRVQCYVDHGQPIQSVQLFYKLEQDNQFQSIELLDDGEHDDRNPFDNFYGGTIPAQPDQAIVEFYIQAQDIFENTGVFPRTNFSQVAIYRVEDREPSTELPLYRIIMRQQDENQLRTRSAQSNVELPASFVFRNEIFYNVGVRFRGKGSRGREPKSYRVNFSSTRYFGAIRKLNLNAIDPHRQYVGLAALELLNLPTPSKQLVSILFNRTFVNSYIQVERTGKDMMERLFEDESGNLYRGIEQANLDYRGDDPRSYLSHYAKITNELQNDYSDIILLCAAFSNPPTDDEHFVEELSNQINIQQWMRWFAAKKILNDQEGGLSKERGDDYYMYHNPVDDLFYVLSWDLDSVLVRPYLPVHHHEGTAIQNTIGRMLRHPDLARFYYVELVDIMENDLPQTVLDSIIDQTSPVASEAARNDMKQVSREIREFLQAQIPRQLTVEKSQAESAILIPEGAIWHYFPGQRMPQDGWNQADFDHSRWNSGPGGIGYGDNDDQTVLDNMRDRYTTVYMRANFQIDDPQQIESLQLRINYDDAFVAYLNGEEVARSNFSGEPLFFSTADSNHEAGAFETFPINNFSELIQEGQNTLAVIGLNVSLGSSDLTVNPILEGSTKSANVLELHGEADSTRTRWVRVNGELVNYIPWRAQWNHLVELNNPIEEFLVESLDADLNVIDSKLVRHNQQNTDGNYYVFGEETWSPSNLPDLNDQYIIVPEQSTLYIQPGTHIHMSPSKAVIVYGTLVVEGTSQAPVLFQSTNPNQNWGGIAFQDAAGIGNIAHTRFVQTRPFGFQNRNYVGAISIQNSTVDVSHCIMEDIETIGISAVRAFLTVQHCQFRNMGEMIHCTNSYSIIEKNLFENINGSNDAIDFDGAIGGTSIIRANTIRFSDNDGIDMGSGASPIIEGNWIEGCADKGISLESPSTPKVYNNIIVDCNIGVTAGDSTQMEFIHNTIVSCQIGVSLVEKIIGNGGGYADIINSIIWNTELALEIDDKSSATILHSNIMQLSTDFLETNFSISPEFVDGTQKDFNLREESPMINKGIQTNLLVDYEGNSRPNGQFPDLGAIEFISSNTGFNWNLYSNEF